MVEKEVLLIEDDAILADALGAVLKIEGYCVFYATNGKTALELCHRDLPDVVISDVLMNEMDGFTFLQQLRQLPGGADLPVVVMTGQSEQIVAENAKAHHVVALLEKPFEMDVFLHAVSNATIG
jgi:CheY-like chemotaxis protein